MFLFLQNLRISQISKHLPLLDWETRLYQKRGESSGCPIAPTSSLLYADPTWTWAQGTSRWGTWPGWKVAAGTVHVYQGCKCTGSISGLWRHQDELDRWLMTGWYFASSSRGSVCVYMWVKVQIPQCDTVYVVFYYYRYLRLNSLTSFYSFG